MTISQDRTAGHREAADWHEYRRLQDAQQRRYERAGVGGGQEEYDQYFGRGEHAGAGTEHRITPQEWMRWSRKPTFEDLPAHEQEWHRGYELGESHGQDADRADFAALDREHASSPHPEHFYRGYVEGLHAGLGGEGMAGQRTGSSTPGGNSLDISGRMVPMDRYALRQGFADLPAEAGTNQRFARFLAEDMPAVVKMAHDSGDAETIMHCPFCFTGSTQYITRSGVRTFDETVGSEQWVLSANPHQRTEGRWVKARIHAFGQQPILRVTMRRNKRTKVVEATPDHRWLVKSNQRRQETITRANRKGKPRAWHSPECARGHKFTSQNSRIKSNGTRECKTCAAMAKPVGGASRAINTEILTRNLKPGMRLSSLRHAGVGDLDPDNAGVRHGVVFGDGSACGNTASVELWGEKDKQLLRYFPDRRYKAVNTANRILGTGVAGVRVSGDLWAWMKAIPSSDLSQEYLYGWLAGYFAADGTVTKQGQASLSSANLVHLEAVRDIALSLGISTYGITKKMRSGFPGREPSALFSIEFVGSTLNEKFFLTETHRDRFMLRDYAYERLGWTVVSVEDTGRAETVYCAVVPDTHSFALADNVWVGNCGSGKVTARSDGTAECGFCRACFVVQTQPQYPSFPQTINGVPIQVPGMGPQWPGQDDADMQRAQQAQEGIDVPEEDDSTDEDFPSGTQDDVDSEDTDEPDKTGNPFVKKSYRSARGDVLTEDQLLRHVALETTHDRARMLKTIRTRGLRKRAYELPESVDVGGGERARVITDEHARGDSKPVSLEEFTEHAREGKRVMDEHRAHAEHPQGLYDPKGWEKIKRHTHEEIHKSWGGSTINAHSGEPLDSHADAYAITVKPPRTDSVMIHEKPSYEDWSKAMDHARARFHGVLRNRNHYLGVFHDDDLKRVDIDPVVVSHDRDEAARIGAYTHNIGGAYNFKDGNGYWPAHVRRHNTAASLGTPMPFQGIGHWYAHAASLEGGGADG